MNQSTQVSTITTISVPAFGADKTAVLSLIDSANVKPITKAQYARAIAGYLEYGSITDPNTLANYANQLSPSTARHLQAAVSKWATMQKKQLRNMATPDNLAHIQAMMYRLDGIGEAIEVKSVKGDKAHIWLTGVEQDKILELVTNGSLISKRDEVLIRLLLATGLRRNEATAVCFDNIVSLGSVPILEVVGKGDKRRQIPIGSKLADFLEDWRLTIKSDVNGRILRSVSQSKEIGESISGVSVYRIVNKYGRLIGKEALALMTCAGRLLRICAGMALIL